jgi:hypothetical protein
MPPIPGPHDFKTHLAIGCRDDPKAHRPESICQRLSDTLIVVNN